MAVLMTALVFTACSKGEDDEPEVKKPSIEEVLRLDDILFFRGDTVDVDFMTAQYKKIGYELSLDERKVYPGVIDEPSGNIFYHNEQYQSNIFHQMRGNFCLYAAYISGLFTYDMKDEAIRYINKRFNITLERSTEPGQYLPDTKDYYFFSDGFRLFSLRLKDNSCEFSFARLDIFE